MLRFFHPSRFFRRDFVEISRRDRLRQITSAIADLSPLPLLLSPPVDYNGLPDSQRHPRTDSPFVPACLRDRYPPPLSRETSIMTANSTGQSPTVWTTASGSTLAKATARLAYRRFSRRRA